MVAREPLSPVLSGPSIARGRRLKVRAREGELLVDAPKCFIQGLFDWCDGSRDLDALKLLAEKRWGPDTRFPRFVEAMMDAGVLLEARVAEVGALRAAVQSCRRPTRARHLPPQGGIAARHLVDDANLLGLANELAATRRARSPGQEEHALNVLLVVRQPSQCFRAQVHALSMGEDGAPLLTPRGSVDTGIYRAFVEPLLFERCQVVLVMAADLDAQGQCIREILMEAGALADRAERWARDRGFGYLPDLQVCETVGAVCGIERERLIYVAGVGAAKAPDEGISVSWEDTSVHANLHIAKAVAPDPAGKPGRLVAWGRSYDPREALCKALGELAERIAMRQPGHSIEAACCDLPSSVPPTEFVRYSPRQYGNGALGVSPFVPEQSIHWVEGWEWLSGRPVWLPEECVFGRGSGTEGRRLMRITSSGCASDVDVEAAVERALHEIIERDALARHWFAQKGSRPVDGSSLPLHLKTRISALAILGCETLVGCTTLGLGPSIVVLMRSERHGFACLGCACDSAPRRALERAFVEAEFAALARCHGVRSRSSRPRDAHLPEHHAALFAQRAFYRRADVLFDALEAPVSLEQVPWPSLEQRLVQGVRPVRAYWVALPATGQPTQLDGRPLRTVRALIPGCVPLAFGYGALPEGMVTHRIPPRARFPHPLA